MARARNIKPGFFTNDVLAECDPLARILFAGLWCHADRAGRIEDRPKKLKAEILPYDDADIEFLLSQLAKHNFILRYAVDGVRYIQIVTFEKHQNPHVKEAESIIPAPDSPGASTVQAGKAEQPSTELAGLIPDSLNPLTDSGLPDSLIPDSVQKQPRSPAGAVGSKKPAAPKPETETAATWDAYSRAYEDRYHTPPVRNATVNSKMAQFVGRIGRDEAPHVARFFVGHNASFYVRSMHAVGMLLQDAEKLRTEWATNTRMTQAKAQQADKTETNLDAFGPLIAAQRAREEAEKGTTCQVPQ